MKKNIGKTDKTVRIILAVLLGVLGYTGVVTGVTATVFLVIAGLLIVTSTLSFCPLYPFIGVNTSGKSANKA